MTIKKSVNKSGNASPFLKWVGGKTQLLKEISQYYPFETNPSIDKYAEPFVGGGAVLFDILNKFDLKQVYISDINAELINTYIVIRDNLSDLIPVLQDLELRFLDLENEERKNLYYDLRAQFNKERKCRQENNVYLAALMIFLNRTCFNGLYRVNKNGDFNVPMGAYKRPIICNRQNLENVSRKIQNVKIVCADYRESLNFIDEHTFAYFDPPYRPISPTANFTSYTEQLFNDANQLELANYIQILDNKGASIIVSNSDPKNVNEEDDFFEDAYKRQNVNRVFAKRQINSDSSKRGLISELLIANHKLERLFL